MGSAVWGTKMQRCGTSGSPLILCVVRIAVTYSASSLRVIPACRTKSLSTIRYMVGEERDRGGGGEGVEIVGMNRDSSYKGEDLERRQGGRSFMIGKEGRNG